MGLQSAVIKAFVLIVGMAGQTDPQVTFADGDLKATT